MQQASWAEDEIAAGLDEIEAIVPSAECIVKEILVGVPGSIVTGMGGLVI